MTYHTAITPALADRIRDLYAKGMSGRAIAEAMGINKSTANKYLVGYRQPDEERPLPTGRSYAQLGSTLDELASSTLSAKVIAGTLGIEIEEVKAFRAKRRSEYIKLSNRGRERSPSQGTADLARASQMLLRALRSHPMPVEMEGPMRGDAVTLRMDAGA
jgi:predicted transcriptional regulator